MAKPVDNLRQVRYDLWYFNLLVIIYYTMKDGFFGVRFSVFGHKIGLRRIAELLAILQQPQF